MRDWVEFTPWKISVNLLGFSATLMIAIAIGFVGDAIMPGRIPFGRITAIIIGTIGSTVGTALLGGWGPEIGGVFLLPALAGAAIFVILLELTLSAFAAKPS